VPWSYGLQPLWGYQLREVFVLTTVRYQTGWPRSKRCPAGWLDYTARDRSARRLVTIPVRRVEVFHRLIGGISRRSSFHSHLDYMLSELL
jgi:hypothetical protein